MPITKLTRESLATACAVCAATRTLATAALVVGVDQGEDIIALPPCDCGAREVLGRTWDACPGTHHGSRFDLHRRAVNLLAHRLVTAGQVHPVHAAHPKNVGQNAPSDIATDTEEYLVAPPDADSAGANR